MKREFSREYILDNCGCYEGKHISFILKNKKIVTIEEIVNCTNIPLNDKYWFLIKKTELTNTKLFEMSLYIIYNISIYILKDIFKDRYIIDLYDIEKILKNKDNYSQKYFDSYEFYLIIHSIFLSISGIYNKNYSDVDTVIACLRGIKCILNCFKDNDEVYAAINKTHIILVNFPSYPFSELNYNEVYSSHNFKSVLKNTSILKLENYLDEIIK